MIQINMREYTLRHDVLHGELSGQLAASFWSAVATSRVDAFATLRSEEESRQLAAAGAAKARHLRRQVLVTVAGVYVSFLLRAVCATLNAKARGGGGGGGGGGGVEECT